MTRKWLIVLLFAVWAVVFVPSCGDDDGDGGLHWFDCRPVLAKLDQCDVLVSFDGETTADAEEAYESCQFARGNMWLEMYKCYKEQDSCEDLAACLPDHGFIPPADDDAADDDTTDDDTADDDTADDDAADDDTAI